MDVHRRLASAAGPPWNLIGFSIGNVIDIAEARGHNNPKR